MTGSGSTVFALVRSPYEAAALASRLRARGISSTPVNAVETGHIDMVAK